MFRYHPDVSKSSDDEQRFLDIQAAYEVLLGKARGKELDLQGGSQKDWDFHDWYWKFRAERSRQASQPHVQTPRNSPNIPSQLAGLRQRAASRAHPRPQRTRHHERQAAEGSFAHDSASSPEVTQAAAGDEGVPGGSGQQDAHSGQRVVESSDGPCDSACDKELQENEGVCGASAHAAPHHAPPHAPHGRPPMTRKYAPSAEMQELLMRQLSGLTRKNSLRHAQ